MDSQSNEFKIYVDALAHENDGIVGFKGKEIWPTKEEIDKNPTGYIFAPYISLFKSKQIQAEELLKAKKQCIEYDSHGEFSYGTSAKKARERQLDENTAYIKNKYYKLCDDNVVLNYNETMYFEKSYWRIQWGESKKFKFDTIKFYTVIVDDANERKAKGLLKHNRYVGFYYRGKLQIERNLDTDIFHNIFYGYYNEYKTLVKLTITKTNELT